MAKNKNLKRKPTQFAEKKTQNAVPVAEPDSEHEEEEFELSGVNNEGESSDSEVDKYASDDDSELSFESDDEGNYKANANKKHQADENGDESDEEIDDEDIEDIDDEELDGEEDEEIDDDDIEDIDDEDDEDDEEVDDEEESEAESDDENAKGNETKLQKPSVTETPKANIKEKKDAEALPTTSNKKSAKKSTDKKLNEPNAVEKFKNELNKSAPKQSKSTDYDEYEKDTDDEEDIRNTVGNIPMKWYDEYKHIGYDWDAKKIIKPDKGDQLDDFLKRMEDPNFWRTVRDPQTGQEVILSDADIELIKRINSRQIPDAGFNEYAPWIDWFSSEVERMPIRNVPDHKRSFIPSVSEKKKVSKLVNAIKMGWVKTNEEMEKARAKKGPQFYMLWESDTGREDMRRIHDHVSAPKRDLPGHAESFNPPPEYLFDEKELREWHKSEEEPSRRKLHFIPQKYNSLREVPSYPKYIRERFLRCLDLYLCPRARRTKLTIDAEYLIPKLPSPKDLQPFPTVESMVYTGHSNYVRTVTIEPKGEYIASGSDDTTVKIWEIATGRCIKTIETGDVVRSVAWCPNAQISLIAIASGDRLILVNPKVGDKMLTKKTDEILLEAPQSDQIEDDRIKTAVQWSTAEGDLYEKGYRLVVKHFKEIQQVTWHGRGDYFATVMPQGDNRSALIHQLSKRRTQIPLQKSNGLIQCVLFHPFKPCLFVATQTTIRIYDLVKQEQIKKLLTNCRWISGMSIHPKGDNLIVSTYDKKVLWFDLDLSVKPYTRMGFHRNAVRGVAFHLRYPLFASASDDPSVIVSHGMVYNDLTQNALIVPCKKLATHEARDVHGVFDVVWHPTQPWLFSCGADATIRLYT